MGIQQVDCIKFFCRYALAIVVIRSWMCEEMKKQSKGMASYWLERLMAWQMDRSRERVAMFMYDVASEKMTGALQARLHVIDMIS